MDELNLPFRETVHSQADCQDQLGHFLLGVEQDHRAVRQSLLDISIGVDHDLVSVGHHLNSQKKAYFFDLA